MSTRRRKIAVLGGLLLVSPALAAVSSPLSQVFRQVTQQVATTSESDSLTVNATVRVTGGAPVSVYAMGFIKDVQSRAVSELLVGFQPSGSAPSGFKLSSAQANAASGVINQAALKCFNVLPERSAAIKAWVVRMATGSTMSATASFGPLTIKFSNETNRAMDSWMYFQMS